MRHVHTLTVRFRDLDGFGHVNNAVYADYAAEALHTMRSEGLVDTSPDVSAMELTFRRSLLLSTDPFQVVSELAGDVLTQDVVGTVDAEPIVFATVVTRFGDRPKIDRRANAGQTLPVRVRWDDLGPDGAVRPARLVHLLQEARGAFSRSHDSLLAPRTFVIGGLAIEIGEPLRWRAEPYEARVWIGRIGTKTVDAELVITDGTAVHLHARSTLVATTPETHRSRLLSDAEVERVAGIRIQSNPPA